MRTERNGKILAGLGIFLGVMLLFTLISKGIYAMQLPQVTVDMAKKGTINHEVRVDGSIKPAKELALHTKAGLRVSEIFVTAGDRVEEGQLLFTLDTAYMQEMIEEKALEVKKLELQVATMQGNLELAGEEKTRQMQRALQDGAVLQLEADKQLERAKEDEAYAKRELSLYVADTPEGEDEAEWKAWEEGRKALALKLKDAERAREDAEAARQAAILEAGRGLEDQFSQENADAALGVSQMELSDLNRELEELRLLVKENGEVHAQNAGTITQVNVSVGGNTTELAAVIFADTATPLWFEAVLDKEQKKYVEQGTAGELSLGSFQAAGGRRLSVTVDYLTEADGAPGSFLMRMFVPEGNGTIGQNAVFVCNVQSESFPYCISMDALHQDENQRSFVYVLEETNTMLGRELVARKRIVEVLDQNDQNAAVAPGSIDETDQIIQTATQPFTDGAVVRMKD